MTNTAIACSLTESEFQIRRVEVLQKLKAHVQEQKELADGYALRFAADDERLDDVMTLIRLERTCCAFLTIRLTAEPHNGPFWLELTGPSGAKEFIRNKMELAD